MDSSFLMYSSKNFEARSAILLLPVHSCIHSCIIKKDVKYKQIKSKIVNYTYFLLPKLYKKLYTGIISWFIGSFTNFVIRKVYRLSSTVKNYKITRLTA